VWISEKCEKWMAADPARIPPNSWNGSFWLRRQKFLKRQFLKSGLAEKNYPADRPRYIINNYQNIYNIYVNKFI
jgi:hypothetical protein